MSLQTTRIISLIVLFLETIFVGFVPLYLIRKWYQRKSAQVLFFSNDCAEEDRTSRLTSNAVIQVLLQFGGGVLFATVFTHLIPETKESFDKYSKSNASILPSGGGEGEDESYEIPYVEIAICFGFFLIFLIEELMHYFVNRLIEHQNKHQNCYNRDLITRSSILSTDSQQNCNHTETKRFSCAYDNYSTDMSSEIQKTALKTTVFVNSNGILDNIPTVCETTTPSHPKSHAVLDKKEDKGMDREIDSFFLLFFRGLVIIFAFSVHNIFDGLAIGLQTKTTDLWSMFFAISVHKLVIAFVVSLQLFDQSNRLLLVAIHMSLFSLMSPIGILIVVLTENSLLKDSESNPIVILLTSIAAGTLLYITFYEILQKDRCELISGFVQFLSILVGFALMLTINILLGE